MHMIVAITGANGFIGRHLVRACSAARHEVLSVTRREYETDLARALTGADVVIHAAAMTRAPSAAMLTRANVDLTAATLDAARTVGARRFVFISSQAAAGPASARDEPVTEDDPPAPIEEYGRTKLAAERLVADSGIPFTIVRPAAVYGPGDRDFAVAFAFARRGIAIHPGNREQWISIVQVDDCVDGILAAATIDGAIGRTYFLANDEPVQWKEIYRRAAGEKLRLDVEIPMPLARVGALAGDVAARITGTAGLLSSEKLKLAAPRYWICSNKRAKRELGFAPSTTLAF